MSQAGELNVVQNHPSIPTTFVTDSGTATPLANVLTILGLGSITTSAPGNLDVIDVSLTGLTNHAVLVGAGTTTITKLALGTNGQVLVGSTAADPVFTTLTSSDGSVTFTTGPGTLSLQVAGGATTIETITGNDGVVEHPLAGNFNIVGVGSIVTVGSPNTETIQLQGLTNHSVLVGAGNTLITKVGPTATAGQVLQSAGAAADPAFSTATYPLTTVINQILFSSGTNTVTGLATANQGVLTTGATGIPVITALATNGQLIIGSTAGVPAAATLTAGAGITITNGSNSITIAVTGAGFNWQTITASQTLVKSNGYMCISAGGALALALPTTASSTIGDEIIVTLDGATSWSITQAAAQQIRVSSAQTTAGVSGSVTSTGQGDTIQLVYQATGRWNAIEFVGNLTVA